jgi:replicative DNA helicase
MQDLMERSHPVDIVTLPEFLRGRKDLEATGGVPYLASLTDGVPRRPSIANYIRIVRDKATARRVIHIADTVIARALDQVDPIRDVIGETEAQLFEIVHDRASKDFASASEIIQESYGGLEGFYRRGERAVGLRTGFLALDEVLGGGFKESNLAIVAARPSMGKTAFALQIAARTAVTLSKNVGIFSLEMSREALLDRMACALAGVNLQSLMTGFLGREDQARVQHALDGLVNANLRIDDTPGISIGEMRSKARKLARHFGKLDLLIVDYLQLMQGSSSNRKGFENRTQEVSAISRGLKILANELRAPVVAVSQLSRASEQRGRDNEPKLSDLRESGSIEQDADVVIFPHRPEYYDRENEELRGKAKLIVAKQRNGPTDSVQVGWQHQYARFVELQGGAR